MQALQKVPCGNTDQGATERMRQGMPHRARKNKGEVIQDEVITEEA